jgi:hypothetical protein
MKNLISVKDKKVIGGRSCSPLLREVSKRSCCLTPYGPPPDRPDIAIYSQTEQFNIGNAPSWDNPDILTNFFNPFRLMPECKATLRNLSATVSAVNTQVLFYVAAFGIGQPRSLLSSLITTFYPNEVKNLKIAFPQSIMNAQDQRIAIHIKIIHPFDSKKINNEGSQLFADAYTSQVGRNFTVHFPILNPLATPQTLVMMTLANQLSATVSPAVRAFGALEQITGDLTIHVPPGVHGTVAAPIRSDVTVVGRDNSGNLIDGLTYIIWIDN